jgi:hypothetical protein
VKIISTLRREIRCDNEADLFIQQRNYRSKISTLYLWKEYRRRRDLCRRVAVDMFIHWCHAKQSIFFDHWKKIILMEKYTETIQRYGRGLIGKLRRNLMKQLNINSVKIQSFSRKNKAKKSYQQKKLKINWAAIMIQKSFRGMLGRRRVQYLIESLYDHGLYQLKKERHLYYLNRKNNAALKIQNLIKKYLKKLLSLKKYFNKKNLEKLENEIISHKKDNLRKQKEYRYELEQWFNKRKKEYDHDRMLENHTNEERNKIIAYRKRLELYEKEKKDEERKIKNEKLEEQYIEQWNIMWDNKKIERSKKYQLECRHSLLNPETPQQRLLKKELEIKIKKRIPEILKKADRMRIPMEIPEAKEIAIEDVIEMEGKEEIERVMKEMYEAALEIEKQKELKLIENQQIEIKRKERLKQWAIVKIQTQVRMMFARKCLREKAYQRYRKEFDVNTKAYYYINLKTNQTSWTKPLSLGYYDIDTKDHWVAMIDAEGDAYYYNPYSWKMTWNQPKGTIFCKLCGNKNFACIRFENDKKFYCEKHFHEIVNELLSTSNATDGDVGGSNDVSGDVGGGSNDVYGGNNKKKKILPQDIKFKFYDCSVVDSNKTYWNSLPTENWLVYCIQQNDKFVRKQSMNEKYFEDDGKGSYHQKYDDEEDDEENDREEEYANNEDIIHYCKRCETFQAEMRCYTCDAYYCKKCYDRKHKTPPWNTHTYKELAPLPAIDTGS